MQKEVIFVLFPYTFHIIAVTLYVVKSQLHATELKKI